MANANLESSLREIRSALDQLYAERDSAQKEIERWSQVTRETVFARPIGNRTSGEVGLSGAKVEIASRGEKFPDIGKELVQNLPPHQRAEEVLHKAEPAHSEPPRYAAPQPPPRPERQWFYALGGRSMGPVAESALLNLLQQGELPPSTLVWNESLHGWTSASETALAASFRASPAPPAAQTSPVWIKTEAAATEPAEAKVVVDRTQTASLHCPRCNRTYAAGAFCTACGAKLEALASVATGAGACVSCRAPLKAGAKLCNRCGAPVAQSASAPVLASNTSICVGCGAPLPTGEKFCTGCGRPVSATPVTSAPVTPSQRRCPNGHVVAAGKKFCTIDGLAVL